MMQTLTAPNPNRLIMQSMYNVRELGGYPANDGRVTQYRRFLRADVPACQTPDDLRTLLEFPVRTVIDLRSPSENDDRPYLLRDYPAIDYHNVPLLGFDMLASIMAMNDSDDPFITVSALYARLLDKARLPIGQVMQILAHAKPGACMFHCTHGKDRTGIIACLLLLLAGVPDQDIVANYEVSATYLKPWFDTFTKDLQPEILHFFRTEPENMSLTLEYLRKTYISAEIYLTGCGVSSDDITTLRDRLLG